VAAAAPTELGWDQLDFYRDNGYLLIHGLLDQATIDAFNAHIWQIRAAPTPPGWAMTPEPDGTIREEHRFSRRLFNPHLHDERSLRLMKLPRVGRILGELLGGAATGVQSMYFYKVPGTPGQANHQDYEYIKNELNTLTACWIAMDDADEENGCLWVVPGTNRGPLLGHGAVRDTEEHEDWTTEAVGIDHAAEVPVRMRSGDALFFHNLLVHSSTRNRSASRTRRAYVCHYIRHDSVILREDLARKIPFDDQEI
jgi:phytanoyl-CoA hydroxylase